MYRIAPGVECSGAEQIIVRGSRIQAGEPEGQIVAYAKGKEIELE